MAQHFEVTITPPDENDDRQEVDAEQVARWINEHRPRHTVTVRRHD